MLAKDSVLKAVRGSVSLASLVIGQALLAYKDSLAGAPVSTTALAVADGPLMTPCIRLTVKSPQPTRFPDQVLVCTPDTSVVKLGGVVLPVSQVVPGDVLAVMWPTSDGLAPGSVLTVEAVTADVRSYSAGPYHRTVANSVLVVND